MAKAKKAAKKGASAKVDAAKKSAKAPKKGAQLKLPGKAMNERRTEEGQVKRVVEVDAAAEEFRIARDARMELSKDEKAAKTRLLDVAKKHGVKLYIYESEDGEELEVEYTAKTDENITVRKRKDDEKE